MSLDATLLYAAFGALRAGFPQASAADMSWVLNGYTVVYAAMLIPSGGLADAYGRKRMFLTGVALFLAASAACILAGGVGWLVAARVAQAVGAALLTPASLSIVLAAFPVAQRTVAVSLWGAVAGLAAAVGPSLGAFVVDAAGWPWAFYINVPLGALSLWRGARLLQESVRPESRRRLDGVGMALLILAWARWRWPSCSRSRRPGRPASYGLPPPSARARWPPSWPGPASRRSRWWTWRCSSTAAIATRTWRR